MAMLTLRARRIAPRTAAEETEGEVMRALTSKAIAIGAVVLLGVGIAAAVVLLNVFGSTDPARQLDAIRTAGTIVVGTGGAAALLLAARRQRSAELTLAHQQRVADEAKYDATQRRITEIFVKAVEQLGSEKAALRHGGLYSLERVAQDHPDQRQTVVNVICTYLRGPFTPSEDDDIAFPALGPKKLGVRRPLMTGRPIRAAASNATLRHRERSGPSMAKEEERRKNREEREVRMAAQRVLTRHLKQRIWEEGDKDTFWEGVALDLRDASLVDADFTHCHIVDADFYDTMFFGHTNFSFANFGAFVSFIGSKFKGDTSFAHASFEGDFTFFHAEFDSEAAFYGVESKGKAEFDGVEFDGPVDFSGSQWHGNVEFVNSSFKKSVEFQGVEFDKPVDFSETHFFSGVGLMDAKFAGGVDVATTAFNLGVPTELAHFITGSDYGSQPAGQQLESGAQETESEL